MCILLINVDLMQQTPFSVSQKSAVKIHYRNVTQFTLTKVKIFSASVITAILDHLNCFMACISPKTCVSSLDTVLRKSGNISVSERRGDPDVGEIWNNMRTV